MGLRQIRCVAAVTYIVLMLTFIIISKQPLDEPLRQLIFRHCNEASRPFHTVCLVRDYLVQLRLPTDGRYLEHKAAAAVGQFPRVAFLCWERLKHGLLCAKKGRRAKMTAFAVGRPCWPRAVRPGAPPQTHWTIGTDVYRAVTAVSRCNG